ncbi:membrane lipoprotein lipid attachment site-containing protein [Halobacillus shinanisalinarum]|uniref:Membrane lipoprotein lipid attachment site-containing protein n=1 Tax=Halobacillus shinanisalinarum TaxID=2932258 RepID=A0ABY4GYZ7_9BACI|nr:membrane lipoprotein lipid attachment site-containing protein [Halobacillus shinanisalinarum]UOQ93432.1 membrane lipoprotein lipid attachment site-containing protein [Halobacillus shinanisalinarum]
MKRILLTLSAMALLGACSEAETTLSKEEFEQLEEGMTHGEVIEVAGGQAADTIDDGALGGKELTYKGEGGVEKDSEVYLYFEGEKLSMIVDSGLMEKEPEDDRELIMSIDYEVVEEKENTDNNSLNLRVKLPSKEEYLYNFSAEDVVNYIKESHKEGGYDAIWVNVHSAGDPFGDNLASGRIAYTQKGAAMIGADKAGEVIIE